MNVGHRIKARRKELGLSADDVAIALNKDRSTVYRYESSDIEKLPTTILEPLSKVLKTTPAYLMGWKNPIVNSSIENSENSEVLHLYNQLDIEDKAEIRGEMKHMLKADKYRKSNTYQSPPREIAAFGADGTKGTHKRPKREIT